MEQMKVVRRMKYEMYLFPNWMFHRRDLIIGKAENFSQALTHIRKAEIEIVIEIFGLRAKLRNF